MASAGRTDMIVAPFHLHNFSRDEQASMAAMEKDEDPDTGKEHVQLAKVDVLP